MLNQFNYYFSFCAKFVKLIYLLIVNLYIQVLN